MKKEKICTGCGKSVLSFWKRGLCKFSYNERLSNIFAKTRHTFGDTSCLDEWFEKYIINKEEIVGMEFADTRWNTLTFGK